MFHIAQSMTKEDLQNVRFMHNLHDYNEYCDAIDLMTMIETGEAVGSVEELREVVNKLGLSHLIDKAMSARTVLQTLSFCDGTGCEDGNCLYRSLWTEKFPHQSSPMFTGERLLGVQHDDICTDSDSTDEEKPIGEGRFGKVYKGQ